MHRVFCKQLSSSQQFLNLTSSSHPMSSNDGCQKQLPRIFSNHVALWCDCRPTHVPVACCPSKSHGPTKQSLTCLQACFADAPFRSFSWNHGARWLSSRTRAVGNFALKLASQEGAISICSNTYRKRMKETFCCKLKVCRPV